MPKENLISQSSFTKGMNQDTLSSLTDYQSYYMARNAVHSTREAKNFGLTNEGSTEKCGDVPGNIIGTAYNEERNWTIIFTADDAIHMLNHANCEVKEVMSAGEFGCDFGFKSCEWVGNNAYFKTMDPCNELHVYFTANSVAYKVNIDLMLDADRKAGLQAELGAETKCGLRDNCEYFRVFKQGCAPTINAQAFQDGGGQAQAGAYTFCCRYKHIDGGETNVFHFSPTVFIGSEHNIAGEQSTGHIEVSLSGLDCKFAEIDLYVIEDVGGIITAKLLNTINYNNHHYTYRYNGLDGTPVDITELLVKEHVYLEPRHMEPKDGHMLYYGIKSRKNVNYQPLANGIETEWVKYEMPVEHAKKYNVRGFMGGETYAFGIVLNYIDGSHSPAFHIPGSPSGGGSAGDQTSSVSENFVEQANSNSNLQSGGAVTIGSSPSSASSDGSSSTLDGCEFSDIFSGLDITYTSKIVPDGSDELSLFMVGDTTQSEIVNCIWRSIEKEGKNATIYVTGHNGDQINFSASSIQSYEGSNITLSGEASAEGDGVAAHIMGDFTGEILGLSFLTIDSGSSGGSSSGSGQQQAGSSSASITMRQEVERKREELEDDRVHDPQNDHFDDIMEEMVDAMDTEAERDKCLEILLWEEHLKAHCCMCNEGTAHCANEFPDFPTQCPDVIGCSSTCCPEICCPSGEPCDGGSAYERCIADIDDAERTFAKWENLVQWYNQDKLEPTYSADKIYQGARDIMDSIQLRERLLRKRRMYNISKSVDYGSGGGGGEPLPVLNYIKGGGGSGNISGGVEDTAGTVTFAGPMFDNFGANDTEIDILEVDHGSTEPDAEQDIIYPSQTDCNGGFIYGGLAGSPVTHHKFPDSSTSTHFVSKAIGAPKGRYYPDAGESSDLYVRIMGVRFKNIQLPSEDATPLPLCPNNPYSIVMVKRTDTNRKVILKGLATGTFKIDSNGKPYDHPRYGLNSKETVSYYHDDGEGNRLSSGGNGSSHTLYSLDGATIKPALHATTVKEEQRLTGQGERYGLYAKGKEPDDAIHGSRIDAWGARQAINLHLWSTAGGEHDLIFKKYAKGDEAVSPGSGGDTPLMNRSQQPCIWIGSGLAQLTDSSFTGDVLEHNVPIPEAIGQYVSLRRELPNQYGNLENLNYIPLMHAGKNHGGTIEGPVGDTYVGPYSFVKTGFVSDKVGLCEPYDERFNIPAMLPEVKRERRCICDGPEDVIHHMNGAWVWTEPPEDGDAADPKNWAGTHTIVDSITHQYEDSVGQDPISDFYLPGTTTTLITYVGEFETNPWLREKSDLLEKQWWPEFTKSEYYLDSGVSVDNNVSGWENGYLNQFHREIEHPSLWKRVVKTIVRTSLNVLGTVYGLDRLFDADNGGIDFVGNLVEFPMIAVLWYLMVQVLMRNEFLDKLLGIPICKNDITNGFPEGYNKGLFFNPTRYNIDYSKVSDLYTYKGMPDPYYVCDCGDETSNEIYISDRQVLGSSFDAWTHVKPLSKIHIPANYGKLTNLATVGETLYAHTTDALIRVRHNRTLTLDENTIVLGSRGFLDEPEGTTEGVIEGYAGLKRHNEHADTQYGYFFVDGEADIVYRLAPGGQLDQISSHGMFNFFKEKLNFCNPTDCIDERVNGTSYYALGVDPRHNRFLITKSESNPNNSFTMSYDLERRVWISFHDYIPRAYIWDRRDMYSLSSSGIWKHNQDCSFQTYYGQFYPHEIEFIATSNDVDTFIWDGVILNTEAEICSGCSWIEDLDVTFNKMAFWNSSQGTGTINLVHMSDDKGQNENIKARITDLNGAVRAFKKRRFWEINEIKDFRSPDCLAQPLTICEACQPIPDINNEIFDCSVVNKQNFRNKVIGDKFARYRFIFDQRSDINLNTIFVRTYGKPNNF